MTKFLHWSTALLILGHIPLGVWMKDLPIGLEKVWYYNLHKSLGLIILSLIILRIVWRYFSPPPDFPDTMSPLDKNLARTTHLGLYGMLIAQAVIGILHSWASGYPIVFFNTYALPGITLLNKSFADWLSASHFILGWGIAALVIVHIGAALKHHYLDKDNILIRMLPFCRVRN